MERSGLSSRIALRSEVEVGERMVAVPVEDELGHLAAVDVEQVRSRRLNLSDLQPACPASARNVERPDPTVATAFS